MSFSIYVISYSLYPSPFTSLKSFREEFLVLYPYGILAVLISSRDVCLIAFLTSVVTGMDCRFPVLASWSKATFACVLYICGSSGHSSSLLAWLFWHSFSDIIRMLLELKILSISVPTAIQKSCGITSCGIRSCMFLTSSYPSFSTSRSSSL